VVGSKRTCLLVGAGLCAATIIASPAHAATITVDATADEAPPVANQNCTLREAVEAASANGSPAVDGCEDGDSGSLDTIELAPGTYPLDGAAGEDANQGGDLDIDAAVGAEGPLQIDGTGAGVTIDAAFDDRIIHHLSGELTLSDLTVTGGAISTLSDGQGILSTGSDLTLTGATVTGNLGTTGNGRSGGGIRFAPSSLGDLTIIDSQITDNDTIRTGGGISVSNGDLELTGSVVSGNTVSNSDSGGTTGGGGIYFGGPGGATITSSTISDNTVQAIANSNASPEGGGLFFDTSAASLVEGSTVSGNQVVENQPEELRPRGGGIYHQDLSGSFPLAIVNTTLASNTLIGDADAGNTAFFGGGAFWTSPNGAITDRIVHSTVVGNSSPRGDALASFAFGGGGIRLESSIVDDQDGVVTDTCEGSAIVSGGHNVAMGTSCVDGDVPTDLFGTDPGLMALGPYGGPTETSPPGLASPAVDLVPADECDDGAPAPIPLSADQRQFPRPFDGDGDPGADCDAGAVEVIPCGGRGATAVGGPGQDVITGTDGGDVIHGLGDDDVVKTRGGPDRACGGAGKDLLKGGGGPDKLIGDGGKDRCVGGGGRDRAPSCERRAGIP
jgi:CSLREA domain-containing protein